MDIDFDVDVVAQGSMCLETGAYMVNFAGCQGCGTMSMLKAVDTVRAEDGDDEETVQFTVSGHVVSQWHVAWGSRGLCRVVGSTHARHVGTMSRSTFIPLMCTTTAPARFRRK